MFEDESHELAESQARLDDEARFRVALEAHPGILLGVDPDGRIGYANAQALHSLEYVPDQIRTVHLRELLTAAPPSPGHAWRAARRGAPKGRNDLPRRLRREHVRFRRRHLFDRFLTDISERIQTERLATPSSACCRTGFGRRDVDLGGSQVLLNRGDRLEAQNRQELIADVASEAERLTGSSRTCWSSPRGTRQDLAGDEPLLLQRVFR